MKRVKVARQDGLRRCQQDEPAPRCGCATESCAAPAAASSRAPLHITGRRAAEVRATGWRRSGAAMQGTSGSRRAAAASHHAAADQLPGPLPGAACSSAHAYSSLWPVAAGAALPAAAGLLAASGASEVAALASAAAPPASPTSAGGPCSAAWMRSTVCRSARLRITRNSRMARSPASAAVRRVGAGGDRARRQRQWHPWACRRPHLRSGRSRAAPRPPPRWWAGRPGCR